MTLKRQVSMSFVESTTGEDLPLMHALMALGGGPATAATPLVLAAVSENGATIMYDTALLDPAHPLRAILTLVSHPPSQSLRLAALAGVAKTHIIPMGPEELVFGERTDHFVEYRSILNFVTHDDAHPGWEIVISTVDRYVYLRPTFRTLGSPSKGADAPLVTVNLGARVVEASIPFLILSTAPGLPELPVFDAAEIGFMDWDTGVGEPFELEAVPTSLVMSNASAANCCSPNSVFAEWVNSMTPPTAPLDEEIVLLPFSNETLSLSQLDEGLALPLQDTLNVGNQALDANPLGLGLCPRKQKTRMRRQRYRQRLRQRAKGNFTQAKQS